MDRLECIFRAHRAADRARPSLTVGPMFAMQSDRIVRLPLDVGRIAISLVVYFGIMFSAAFANGMGTHRPLVRLVDVT
jgi:hypothetical protein